MTKKIKPSGRQKMWLVVHFILFIIGNIIMWMTYDKGVKGWAYPWPAWITAAWALWLLGHICILYTSYEDKGMTVYQQQDNQG
ncbi:MAG: hypothetical protein H0X33_12700 [Taibaiella sp.]|nr:hypothetical protein [Taibaiella sp.]